MRTKNTVSTEKKRKGKPSQGGASKRINSIGRGFLILKVLTRDSLRLTEAAEKVGMSNSTVHRLLKQLEASRVVLRDPITKRYSPGPFLLALGLDSVRLYREVVSYCVDEMGKLCALTGESVALATRVGTRRLILEEMPSPQNVKYVLGRGQTIPVHATPSGRVLLAQLPGNKVRALLRGMKLVPVTRFTITDVDKLIEEIEKIRKQGYSASHSQTTLDTAGLAFPIQNDLLPLSITVYSPKYRFQTVRDHIDDIRTSAGRISQALNHVSNHHRGRNLVV